MVLDQGGSEAGLRQYACAMPGSPGNVLIARLVGGEMDGTRVEIEPGRETIEWGPPLVVFGGPAEQVEQLKTKTWTYRYVRVEDGPEGPEAVFQLSEPSAEASS
jgi:hypothetical protein